MVLQWWKNVARRNRQSAKKSPSRIQERDRIRFRPRVEGLEQRVMLDADLVLVKNAPATISPGQVLTYTLDLTNSPPPAPALHTAADNTVVTDTLPTDVVVLSSATTQGTIDVIGGTVTATLGSLAPNDTATITLNVMPTTAGLTTTLTNTATAATSTTDPDGLNNTDMADTNVVAAGTPADLAVTKTGTPSSVVPGQAVTYSITVQNNGANAATATTLWDQLPANSTFVSATGPAGSSCTEDNGVVTCTLGDLAPTDSATVTIQMIPGGSALDTTITNIARATTDAGDTDTTNNTDTETTTLAATPPTAADLQVTKAGDPANLAPGQVLTYTVTVSNVSTNLATATTLIDQLPANVTFISAAGPAGSTCTEAGGVVTCDLGDLAGSASATVTIQVTPTAAAVGTTILNTATASTTAGDSDTANNTATASTMVTTFPNGTDLAVTKSGLPATAVPGQAVTYTITVSNIGSNPATGTTLTDTLTAEATFASAAGPAGSSSSEAGGVVTTNLGTIDPGSSATVTIVVTPNTAAAGTSITNTATATTTAGDNDTSNNTAMATTTVDPAPATAAEISVTKVGMPDTVQPGVFVTYTITVANPGANDAANVVVHDQLPLGTTFVSATSPAGTDCAESNGVVTCTFGTLAAGAGAMDITIVVQADVPGTIINNVTVTTDSGDSDTINNVDSATTTVNAFPSGTDLAVTKTGAPATAVPGQAVTYTITVTNNGPVATPDTMLTDTLPPNVTFAAVSGPAGTTFSQAGNMVTGNLGALAVGASVTILITVVPTTAAAGTQITDSATATTSIGDNNFANNSDSATTTVDPIPAGAADLQVTKSGAPDSVAPGQALTYTITVTNVSANPATSTSIIDQLPADVSFLSAVGPTGSTTTFANGTVTVTLGTLTSNASATVTLVVSPNTPAAATTITNTATASTTAGDSDTADNTASATTTVTDPPGTAADLQVTKSSAPSAAAPGQVITYTITVTNISTNAATAATLTDHLPADITFLSATGPAGSTTTVANGTVTVELGDLAASASATVIITVSPNSAAAGTMISNTAIAITTAGETDTANNTATATTDVTAASAGATDLQVTKAGAPASATPGQVVTYTITVTNIGPNTATGTVVTDNLPANVTFISAAGPAGSTSSFANGTVTVSLGDVAASDSATVIILISPNTAAAGTTITDTAVATTTAGETDTANNTASATTTVTAAPAAAVDLQVTKSGTPSIAAPGQAVTYTITVTNNSANQATSVVLTDQLPANVALISVAGPSGSTSTSANGVVTVNLGDLAASDSATIMILVTPTSAAAGTSITGTAIATTTAGETNTDDNTASATTTVPTAPGTAVDLQVTKSGSPDSVAPGQLVTYTITVTNNSSNTATNTVLSDVLPANVTFISASGPAGSTSSFANGTVTVNLGDLAANASATITILVSPTGTAAATTITDTAIATTTAGETNTDDNTASASTTVTAVPATAADLQVTKTGSPASAAPGQEVTYTITVTNNGANTATATTVFDQLPPNVTFIAAAGPSGSTTTFANGTVTVNLGDLAASASATIVILVSPNTAAAGTSLTDTAIAATSAGETNTDDNSASATTDVTTAPGTAADLQVTKSGSPSSVAPGQAVTYTITVTNNSTNLAASVVLTDRLPANVTFISATGPSGSTSSVANGIVTVMLGDLAANTSATITIVVTPTSAAANTTITDTAVATTTAGETDTSDNTASATTAVTAISPNAADLEVTKTGSPDSVAPGQELIYTITVTNIGSNTATASVLNDTLPPNVTFISVAGPAGTVSTFSNGLVTSNLGDLSANASATITIVVTPNTAAANTTLTNTAVVTTTAGESDTANNTSTAMTPVTAAPPTAADLEVTKMGDPAAVVVGQMVTYTIVVTNIGTNMATGSVLNDILPVGVAFVSATGPAGSSTTQTGNTITTDLGDLDVDGTATITITVRVIAAGSLVDTAVATTTAGETDTANNTATVATTANQAATTTDLTSAPNPSTAGQTVTFTATVAVTAPGVGTPTGMVTFLDGTAILGTGTLANGMATFTTSTLSVGTHSITAVYAGDANFTGSTSAAVQQVVNPAAPRTTTTTLASMPNPSVIGQQVTFTATVTPSMSGSGVPTGTVTFLDGNIPLGTVALDNGMAAFTSMSLSLGLHPISAMYNGDATFAGSTSPTLTQTVTGSPSAPCANPDENWVAQVYRDLLLREANQSELDFWNMVLIQGQDRVQVVLAIQTSSEYRNILVQQLYNDLLRHPPDQAGLEASLTFLAGGGTERQLEVVLISSDDYFLNQGGGTNSGFVQAVYQDVLTRAASDAEIQYWVDQIARIGRQAAATAIVNSPESAAVETQTFFLLYLRRSADPVALNYFVSALTAGMTDEQARALIVGSSEYYTLFNTGLFQLYVAQLYQDLLNRQGATSEIAYWVGILNQGTPPIQVVQMIETSQEFRQLVVQQQYINYLNRAADPGGLDFFTDILAAGGTIEQVKAIIAGSPEFFQGPGGGTNTGFLNAFFQDTLDRAPTEAELANFNQALSTGTSTTQVATTVLDTDEYREVLVNSFYENLLNRQADQNGLDFFVAQLRTGTRDEVVIAEIASSDEYFCLLNQ